LTLFKKYATFFTSDHFESKDQPRLVIYKLDLNEISAFRVKQA